MDILYHFDIVKTIIKFSICPDNFDLSHDFWNYSSIRSSFSILVQMTSAEHHLNSPHTALIWTPFQFCSHFSHMNSISILLTLLSYELHLSYHHNDLNQQVHLGDCTLSFPKANLHSLVDGQDLASRICGYFNSLSFLAYYESRLTLLAINVIR